MTKLESWLDENRPLSLILTFLGTVACLASADWILGANVFDFIFFQDFKGTNSARAWSAVTYTLIVITGLPTAFLLWYWRDRNVRDQLEEKKNEVSNQRQQIELLKLQVETQGKQVENQSGELAIQSDQLAVQREQILNQRKETSLKEFQEVQKLAAGLFEIEGSEAAKTQLQIAAMHQLRGFLQNEFSPTFRRAAFELLLAGHTSSISLVEAEAEIESISWYSAKSTFEKNVDTVAIERAKILRDDASVLIESEFSLQGRRLDFLDLSELYAGKKNFRSCSFAGCKLQKSDFSSAILIGARFFGAEADDSKFENAHAGRAVFKNADLRRAKLDGIRARWSNFDSATLIRSSLKNGNFQEANFEGTTLNNANLSSSDFSKANFCGADLRGVEVDEAIFEDCTFDDKTQFADEWAVLAENAKADYRSRWRDRGMRHVNDQSDKDNDDIPF